MRLEPARPDLPGRRAFPGVKLPPSSRPATKGLPLLDSRFDAPRLLALGAGAGAALLAATATGDVLFVGVLLGLAAADALVGAAGVLVGLGVLGRWGSSSLAALAGGQAVLGPAGWTGSAAVALSSWGGAVALLLLAPPRLVPTLAFGILAAELVAGPALGESQVLGPLALRVAASTVAVGAAWACGRYVPRRRAKAAGATVALVALVLAFVGS